MELSPKDLNYVLPIDPNLICAICADPFVKPKLLWCGHVFCAECITEWRTKCHYKDCPKCRKKVSHFI